MTRPIRVLAGGPSRCSGSPHEVAWRECIEAQVAPGVEVVFRAVDAAGPGYEVGEVAHGWSVGAVHRVALARQRFLDAAAAEGFDAVWMVDDDVLCGPDVLAHLLHASMVRADVIAIGVYYTPGWDPSDPARELPQVWDHHPYSVDPETVDLWREQVVRGVAGGGACTLIPVHRSGEVYWPPLRGVETWGEDRWACLRWAARGVPIVGVGGLPIHHAYQPSQRMAEAVDEAMRRIGVRT